MPKMSLLKSTSVCLSVFPYYTKKIMIIYSMARDQEEQIFPLNSAGAFFSIQFLEKVMKGVEFLLISYDG